MKALPLGIMDYRKLITNDYYAVDKTLMIKDFLERKSEVTLITRPRRFGKTLNMSMMAEFFDITKNSSDLFKDTKIMKTEYAKNINQYPTVFISFAEAKKDKDRIVKYIKMAIRNEYERYDYIFKNMTKFEEFDYNQIINCFFSKENELNNIDNSLAFLMKMLEKYYHKKVMVFIDEYDTPFIEAHINGFYKDINGDLSSLLHNTLKLSPSLQYAMLTGIQKVSIDDLNNLVVCTVADDEYNQYFEFSEEETKQLLEYYGLKLNNEVKEMYDGYHIGNMDIYNPWSIINYANKKELIPYWVNTNANMMIRSTIEKSDKIFKEKYEALIQNGYLETTVSLETNLYELEDESFIQIFLTEILWGLLVNVGYLTIEEKISPLNSIYKVRIPNQEMQKEFQSLIATI